MDKVRLCEELWGSASVVAVSESYISNGHWAIRKSWVKNMPPSPEAVVWAYPGVRRGMEVTDERVLQLVPKTFEMSKFVWTDWVKDGRRVYKSEQPIKGEIARVLFNDTYLDLVGNPPLWGDGGHGPYIHGDGHAPRFLLMPIKPDKEIEL